MNFAFMENKIKIIFIFSVFSLIIFFKIYFYIPSFKKHIERNKQNILPKGKLRLFNKDKNLYNDEANVIWYKRQFVESIFHNPFKNFVFEEYNEDIITSSEVEILKEDFNKGFTTYKPGSYNYYSSIFYPVRHFFADILPIGIYLSPKYKIYKY